MNKNLVIGFIIVLAAAGITSYIVSNNNSKTSDTPLATISLVPSSSPSATITTASATPVATGNTTTMDNGLKIEEIKVGTGAEAVAGKKVTVNYKGTFVDGTQFDSSYDAGRPFTFDLGAGAVIKGWDIGVAGMKVGGKRKLTVPSDLGYGPNGYPGAIPPNATLIFEVELLGVQ